MRAEAIAPRRIVGQGVARGLVNGQAARFVELGAGAEKVTVVVSYNESERVSNHSKVGCSSGLWG